jgi:hypothetical protein
MEIQLANFWKSLCEFSVNKRTPLGALQPATHVLAYPNYDLHSSKFRQTVFTFSCNSDFYYSCVEAFSNLIPQVLKNISTFELCWLTIRGRKLDLPQAVTII